jgi:DNA polymerase-3 subunit alpha
LLGADLWLEPAEGSSDKAASRLLVLVQSPEGYLNLSELLARAWTRNVQRAQAWVTWEWLAELGGGLIALSGAEHGAVGIALLAGDTARARQLAERLASLFPGRFYLELQRAGLPQHEALVRASVPLAAELKLPVVATHPVQFLAPEDFEAHEARVCVAEGETLANPRRIKRFGREQYFKSQAQMEALFADVPSAVANTVAIAQRCNLSLVLGKPRLPDFPTPIQADGTPMPIDAFFRQESFEGLELRLRLLYPDPGKRDAERPRYVERLEFEIGTILKMGFPGYFLIVSDFIKWAKANGCPVGPGRGSGAGSLVAYALSITDLDPLQYNLLFERFLNPERVSMPDFDVDFCQGNRDRVIDYVKDKYGREAVSQIATFGTMAAKAALRDIGRCARHGLRPCRLDRQADPGAARQDSDAGQGAREAGPGRDLRAPGGARAGAARGCEEEVAELLALATRVEGMVRNIGMHAGRRADRAGQDHRLLPAVPAAGQRLGGEPVRQGRRRGHRPGEVRLPGPGHADHPGAGEGFHRRALPGAEELRLRDAAAGRQGGLQTLLGWVDGGGLPVRIPRHAGHAARRQAFAPGRPDRVERVVPPRPDGPDPELRGAQAWPRRGRVSAPAGREGAAPRPTGSWSTRSR